MKQGITLKSNPDQYVTRAIDTEVWREYEWVNAFGATHIVRINGPVSLITRKGGTTHRVIDVDGIVHCVPAPEKCGVVLRWNNKPEEKERLNF